MEIYNSSLFMGTGSLCSLSGVCSEYSQFFTITAKSSVFNHKWLRTSSFCMIQVCVTTEKNVQGIRQQNPFSCWYFVFPILLQKITRERWHRDISASGGSSELEVQSAKCLFVWLIYAHLTLWRLAYTSMHNSKYQYPFGLFSLLSEQCRKHFSALETSGYRCCHQR